MLLLEKDFCRAFVSVSVSRANASEIQESAKVVGLRLQGSMPARFSDAAILAKLILPISLPPWDLLLLIAVVYVYLYCMYVWVETERDRETPLQTILEIEIENEKGIEISKIQF